MVQDLKDWGGLIAIAISLGTVVWGWLTSSDKKALKDIADAITGLKTDFASRVDGLKREFGERLDGQNRKLSEADGRLDDHEKRIQALEGEMKHLPGKDMVHELQLTMKDIQIEMANLKAETQGAARASRRVEEYLIDKASKAA